VVLLDVRFLDVRFPGCDAPGKCDALEMGRRFGAIGRAVSVRDPRPVTAAPCEQALLAIGDLGGSRLDRRPGLPAVGGRLGIAAGRFRAPRPS